ncbi:quinoprotein amine dehydrogenase [Pseudoduganella sp. FT26W]|uniref:Quinoprotein amine dehydrogenase n=1 Tax=Duganella aquatilis TaxID=2666082 RepID=A0A844DES0_9BURK|nr:quinoprotein amine dehydrogenase [Duganella aquatilis]MRW87326.1 quinoprotein amine dehydrogenase [Duganella aquatilis]
MLRLRPAYAAVPFFIAALLAGCGGGGGGGSAGGGTTTPVASPALTFTPASVTGSVTAGTSLTSNITAVVTRPGDFTNANVTAMVVDSVGVLLPNMQLVQDSASQYHAVLQTAPTLAAGRYQGSFSVRLCRDSACASQFPGSPVTLPYDFTVLPAGSANFTAVPAMPLTATIQSGGAAPASVPVAITSSGSWSAASGATWLKLSAASGSGNASLNVSYDLTGLAAGTYTTNLNITSAGNTITLPATLTVLQPGLVLGNNSVTFNAINGTPIASQVVSLDTDNKISAAWTAVSTTPWLSVSPPSGTTPATAVLAVDPTVGALASGSYSGSITITPTGLAERTLPVTLNLTPATLLASTVTLTLGGTYGRDFSSTQVAQPLKLSLNTSTNSWPWQLTNLPTWASATATSGTVNAAGASTSIKATPASAPTGISSQLAGAVAQVNGDAVKASVIFIINKDQHKLLPAETAVAFVSTPTWSRMTRTITVSDNYGTFGGMSATSDQPWLVVGVSGNQLTLTADASQQLTETVNTATITLTALDPDATVPEPIRVALWKGSAAPTASTTTVLPYTNVVTDPARPYAYVHNGGAYIDVYNMYTGLKEASITGFSAHLGDMAVTPNGDALYVVDIDNSRITTVDLATRAISTQLALAVPGNAATRIKLIRPNGVGMLVLSDGQVYLTASNARLPNLPLGTGGTLAASADGKRVVQQDEGNTTIQHTTVSVDYAQLAGGTLFAAKLASASHGSPGAQGQDVWVNSDGTRVIYAATTPKSCTIMDGANLGILGYMAIGDATPNNVAVTLDGRIVCAGAARGNTNDVYLYDSTGAKLIQQYKLNNGKTLLARQLAVSGDGWILVGITNDGAVTFLPIGP